MPRPRASRIGTRSDPVAAKRQTAREASLPAPAAAAAPASNDRAAEKMLLALLGLGIGHVLLYLCLTGDARTALNDLAGRYKPAELHSAAKPSAMPVPGTPAYSPWLHSFQRYSASRDYELHARHESLMRYGMIFSFLIAVGFLGNALHRISVGRKRAERARQTAARAAPVLAQQAQRRYRRSA